MPEDIEGVEDDIEIEVDAPEDVPEDIVDEIIPMESYLTLGDIKNSRIPLFNELPDEFIQKRLNNLSRVIDEYCNTKFTPTIDSWRTDLKSRNTTPNKPLLSVENVEVRGDILVEDADYYVYEKKNLIEIDDTSIYEKKKKALTIDYTYGHKEVPAIVKEVLLELLKDSVSSLSHTTGRVKSEQWEDYSYTLSDSNEVMRSILSMLDKFIEEEEVERQSNKIKAMLL